MPPLLARVMPVRSLLGDLLGCGVTEAMMGDTAIIVGKPSFKEQGPHT